jgi:hypothetical protein
MKRSANKLCAETHYERYVKCLLGIKFTELAAQSVSRSEDSKVISGNLFLENMYIVERNLISYILYYIRRRYIIIQIPNTCFVQPFSHLVGKSRYADHVLLLIRVIYPYTITATFAHDHYAEYYSLLAPFSHSKNSVASTAFRITVSYSTESKNLSIHCGTTWLRFSWVCAISWRLWDVISCSLVININVWKTLCTSYTVTHEFWGSHTHRKPSQRRCAVRYVPLKDPWCTFVLVCQRA